MTWTVRSDVAEILKDDLRSDDEHLRQQATQEATEILDWLSAPPEPLSQEQQLQRVAAALNDTTLPAEHRLAATRRAVRSTGRARGRSRDETTRLAVRALGLHLATGMSWREIAMRLKGCVHERPVPPRQKPRRRNPNLSCDDCGEAMRVAVYRLRRFLTQLGYQENIPLGKELDEKSRMELRKLWASKSRGSRTQFV